MEAPTLLEDGNTPQKRRSTCFQVAFYALIFVLIFISALVPIVFCLLHHKQAPGSCWAHGSLKQSSTQNSGDIMSWDWKLEHCNGSVQDQEQYLIIKQSGNYFVYAQFYRLNISKESFTLMIYKKNPEVLLNKAVGQREGDENGTVNFARPFFLEKGDKLYCRRNDNLDKFLLLGDQTYWGLFKM